MSFNFNRVIQIKAGDACRGFFQVADRFDYAIVENPVNCQAYNHSRHETDHQVVIEFLFGLGIIAASVQADKDCSNLLTLKIDGKGIRNNLFILVNVEEKAFKRATIGCFN